MDRRRAALPGVALAVLAVVAAILLLREPRRVRGPAVPRPSGAASVEEVVAAAAPRAPVEVEVAAPPSAELHDDTVHEERSPEIGLSELTERSAPPPPPGTIQVRVIHGREPAPAWVELDVRQDRPMRLVDIARPAEALARQRSGVDGRALFTDLEPGEYVVRALLDDGAALEERVPLEGSIGRRVFLLFGSGGIRGRVYDEQGTPRAGALVMVTASHPRARALVATAADGSYSAGGLRSGEYDVRLMPSELSSDADVATLRTSLEAGEWRTVDFGSRLPLARWRGAVRLEDGTVAAGPLQLGIRDLQRGTEAWFATGPDGTIDRELLPGRYALSCAGFGRRADLGQVELQGGPQHRDLALPGTQVSGRVLSDLPPERAQSVQVSLKPIHSSVPWRAHVRHRERFAFVAVPPGEYELLVWPGYKVPPIRVVVRQEAARVVLDVPLPAR